MPFPLISTVLGLCFLLMWALIAGMIFRDGQVAVRSERDLEHQNHSSLPNHVALPQPHWPRYESVQRNTPAVENAS